MYDVVIVGAGSAGLTAAIYAGRKQLKTLLITGNNIGGETNSTNDIQNYPSFAGPGPELMKKFLDQAKRWGAEFNYGSVVKVSKDAHFRLALDDGSVLDAKSVILCYGRTRRKLNIPGEDEFFGRGVSTCTTCDAIFYKNKSAAIVGGGNSAVEGALELAGVADKVFLIHRRQGFRADEVTLQKARNNPKIVFVLDAVPVEIKGEKFVTGVKVKNVKTEQTENLAVDGIFLEIGWTTDSSVVSGLVDANDVGSIVVDKLCRTKTAGLFACGDCTDVPHKQTVISAGMGAVAALEAYKFITGEESAGDYVR